MGEMILSADPENPSLQIKFSKLLWNNTVSIMKSNPCEATYKKSELYLQKILKLDPGNTKAIKMLSKVNLEIENLNIKN